ncbi:FG-GAP repeat domain-containing protein [candidate division KSB1 bacterium]
MAVQKKYFICLLILTVFLSFFLISGSKNTGSAGDSQSLSFRKSTQLFEPRYTFQIELADLDNDGDLDAVFANMRFNTSRIWLNDGRGFFTDSGQELTQLGHGVGIGDLDSDGDPDLFMTTAGFRESSDVEFSMSNSKVYLNDGKGIYTKSTQEIEDGDDSGNLVRLCDTDSDGDLDAYVVYYPDPDIIYLNDGSGIFDGEKPCRDNANFADLDGDGDADMLTWEEGKGYRIYTNGGKGNFTEYCFIEDTGIIRCFTALGDIDNDGDIDAVVTNGNQQNATPAKVLINDGSGKFTDSGQKLCTVFAGRVRLGDFNLDGFPDAVFTSSERPAQIWINDGKGNFSDSSIRLDTDNAFHEFAVGDLDGDGDLDIFFPNYRGGSNQIWFNEIR